MQNKRIIIGIIVMIAVCLCICVHWSRPSYAQSTGTVVLTADKSVVEKEEEITITMYMKDNDTSVFHTNLYFDNSKLEYISGPENVNVLEDRIIYVWYDAQGGTKAKQGELATFRFKAKEEGIANVVVDGEFYNKQRQLIEIKYEPVQIQVGKEESVLEKQAKEEQGTDERTNNTNLQVLRIDQEGIVPNFDKEVYEYYLTVPNEVKDIEVMYVTENPDATVEITGNTNLKQGLNTIQINVMSEDKTQTNVYTIAVTKTKKLEAANTNLEVLAIENVLLNPPFDNTITAYHTEVGQEVSELNILAVPENEKATVNIEGKDNLQEGKNTVIVNVTAEDKITKRQYKIDIYKRNQEEEEKYQQEQEEQENKVEEAYKIEELSTERTLEDVHQAEEQSQSRNNILIGIIAVAGLGAIGVTIGVLYDRKKRMSAKK